MLELSLFWILLGIVLGALVNGARCGLRARDFPGWRATLGTLGVGAAGALLFGWLGVLVFGVPFGTPTALWGGILAAVLTPWLHGCWLSAATSDLKRSPIWSSDLRAQAISPSRNEQARCAAV